MVVFNGYKIWIGLLALVHEGHVGIHFIDVVNVAQAVVRGLHNCGLSSAFVLCFDQNVQQGLHGNLF